MSKRGSKRASLKYQFIYAIKKCFKEHYNKRSLKIKYLKGKMNPVEEKAYLAKVWSYQYMDNLIKFVKMFIKWLKEKEMYNEFKYAYEIPSEVFALYLEDLLERGASLQTLKTYLSYIRKLERIMSYTHPTYDYDYTSQLQEIEEWLKTNKESNKKLRVYCLSKENYMKLINYILKKTNKHPMGNDLGILLMCAFGLRASEVVCSQFRDIVDLNSIVECGNYKKIYYVSPFNLYFKVHKGKGGQEWYIPVVFQWQYNLLQYVLELQKNYDLSDSHYILSMSSKTYTDRGLRKLLKKRLSEIGVELSVPTCCHMVRKAWSKMMYEYYKKHPENMLLEHTKYYQVRK